MGPPWSRGLELALLLVSLGRAAAEDTCEPPERFHYAELGDKFKTMDSFPVGTSVSYICRPGYMKIPGKSSTLVCGPDLQWSPTEQFCTERRCRHPGDIEGGTVHVQDPELKFGSKLTFSCKNGSRLRGTDEITCVIKMKTVDWSEDLPFCEQIPCKPPPAIANGHYSEADNYVYLTAVIYECDDVPKGMDRFSLIGSNSIFCTYDADKNGIWSGPPPQCRVVKCDNLKVQDGKKIAGFGPSYSYKDSITFKCDPGYFMVGNETVTCEEDSTWHPPKPTCEKIVEDVCGAPKITDGEVIPLKSKYGKGESVQVKCNTHCTFPDGVGEMAITCEGRDTWSSLQNCKCRPTVSGSSLDISHGRVIAGLKSSYSVGDTVTIECYAGYTLHGEANIQYIGENRWMPEVPTCQLSVYVIVIICVIVAILVLLAAFWVYKIFFSRKGSYAVDESCKETCILKTNVPSETEDSAQMN
ncbi:membrane cofactor protein-like isoform X1 [Dromaius novaehollandiae]|uniref:Membrane cofactor protein-like n=1 Tax=Dromaius novaehollandiae TaxID=8790 RepID=A0A8C4K1U0_DRONO|nr:membrane cofactor protein-like isoform X2 [Dromaius novaehollandiae]